MSGTTFATAPEHITSPSSTAGSTVTIGTSAPPEPQKDFTYLLDQQIFRHLPTVERNQLSLLSISSHLHSIASQCATALPSASATDSFNIFKLWYTRLLSLSLISNQATSIASQEIKVFGDLTSNFYRDSSLVHAVPWELRVLAIRLQALGFNDWRRCLEHFYMLAKEARNETVKNRDSPAMFKLWRRRLLDIGIRVASALVEVSDLDGAERHLKHLMEDRDDIDDALLFRLREAVLYTQLGQLDTAKKCYLAGGAGGGEDVDAVIEGLRLMAVDDFEGAAVLWKKLVDKEEEDGERRTSYLVNMAVSLLYLRRLPEIQSTSTLKFQSSMDKSVGLKSLTYNIATMHELLSLEYELLKLDVKQQLEVVNEEMTGVLQKREQAQAQAQA
ncbi:hypothetical protein ABW19_dt0203582 [Dactylella cylindrospora]|nr:hypothetical protein ABW19_dt0203582 [Dactylella cylindrospora]